MLIPLENEVLPHADFTIIQFNKDKLYHEDIIEELMEVMKWVKIFFDSTC